MPASPGGTGPVPESRHVTPNNLGPSPRELDGNSREEPPVARRLFASGSSGPPSEDKEGEARQEASHQGDAHSSSQQTRDDVRSSAASGSRQTEGAGVDSETRMPSGGTPAEGITVPTRAQMSSGDAGPGRILKEATPVISPAPETRFYPDSTGAGDGRRGGARDDAQDSRVEPGVTFLASDALVGDSRLTVRSTTGFYIGRSIVVAPRTPLQGNSYATGFLVAGN